QQPELEDEMTRERRRAARGECAEGNAVAVRKRDDEIEHSIGRRRWCWGWIGATEHDDALVTHARRAGSDGEIAAELVLDLVRERPLRDHEVFMRMIVRASRRMLRAQPFEHLVALIGRQSCELLANLDDARRRG